MKIRTMTLISLASIIVSACGGVPPSQQYTESPDGGGACRTIFIDLSSDLVQSGCAIVPNNPQLLACRECEP